MQQTINTIGQIVDVSTDAAHDVVPAVAPSAAPRRSHRFTIFITVEGGVVTGIASPTPGQFDDVDFTVVDFDAAQDYDDDFPLKASVAELDGSRSTAIVHRLAIEQSLIRVSAARGR